MERDAATGAKRRPRAPAKESEEAAAPSLAGTGAAAGEAAANLETAAALHAMARSLEPYYYHQPRASTGRGESLGAGLLADSVARWMDGPMITRTTGRAPRAGPSNPRALARRAASERSRTARKFLFMEPLLLHSYVVLEIYNLCT